MLARDGAISIFFEWEQSQWSAKHLLDQCGGIWVLAEQVLGAPFFAVRFSRLGAVYMQRPCRTTNNC
jgi:hypothetical protein